MIVFTVVKRVFPKFEIYQLYRFQEQTKKKKTILMVANSFI